jgi:hypothetical protein
MDVNQQLQFSLIRYEYYIAGRHLFFFAHSRAARIMLGYAVECQLKAALLNAGSRNHKLLYGHDIPALHHECLAMGIISGVAVSDDFVRYIDDNLNQRYPSQFLKMLERATSDGLVVGSSPADILPYDDYILQLDDCIRKLSSEPLSSIGVRGALSAENKESEDFFHSNAAAFSRFDEYLEVVRSFRPESVGVISRLEQGAQAFWRSKTFPLSLSDDPDALAISAPAMNYVYPRQSIITDKDSNRLTMGEITLSTSIDIRLE